MKSVLIGVGSAIIILAAGVVALGYFFGIFGGRGASPWPSPSPSVSPSPTSRTVTPRVTSLTPSPTVPTANVNFEMVVTNVSGSGLSRTVTAQVTNTGSADAHNAWGKVEVFSQSQRIRLSGQDYLRVDIGTVKAGAIVTAQATLGFSLPDGLRIQQNGARVLLTVNSDERTQTLTYDYKP